MLLVRLWNYIRGYVIIRVEGYFLEKFINICIHRQIFLWDISRKNNDTMVLKVSIKGFRLLRPVARKTKCSVKILSKKGLPVTLHRYRGRKAFLAGIVMFIASLYVLTSFLWTVEVQGNDKLQTQLLIDKLYEHGLKPGILKYKVNTDRVVEDMMMEVKELAWIGVSIKGTRARVEVVERKESPEPVVPLDVPCNIVAARDGVIKTVIAKAGQEMVKAGDTVIKGQVLISGTITSKPQTPEAKTRTVHALGEVKARTWYEAGSVVNEKLYEKERTGSKKDTISLVLFMKRFNIYKAKVKYENYEQEEIRKELSIGKDIVLPFQLVIDRFYENSIIERGISSDAAKQMAADKAYRLAAENIPKDAEIVKSNINFVQTGDGRLEAKATVECIEDIGFTLQIGGN